MINKLKSLKNKLSYKYFDFEARGIAQLPSISAATSTSNVQKGLCVLSMVCKRDFYQYLCSIYSFCRYLHPEKIVVVNDGSLNNKHIETLKEKVPNIEILNHEDFIRDKIPTYTSWRRLMAIESLIDRYYVVQLDADIISKHDLDEVKLCAEKNHPFILGTQMGKLKSIEEAREETLQRKTGQNKHVQQASEENLDILSNVGITQYYRGCAGFAGFSKNCFDLKYLQEISNCMYSRIGDKWNEWGSEQTCVNMMMSNFENFSALPLEYYDSVVRYTDNLKLTHFIGSHRFHEGIYNRCAKKLISELQQQLNP